MLIIMIANMIKRPTVKILNIWVTMSDSSLGSGIMGGGGTSYFTVGGNTVCCKGGISDFGITTGSRYADKIIASDGFSCPQTSHM